MTVISPAETDRLVEVCKSLPPAKGDYLETDFVRNLFLTVLDFQMHGRAVENAIRFYVDTRWNEIRTLPDLEKLLGQHAETKDGNTAVAQYLWNNKHWTRVGLLRRLVEFFRAENVGDQATLRSWAAASSYDRDFKGKIHGMGLAIYNWLVMRQGIETVKPDVHLHRFVEAALGRSVADAELVISLREVAKRLSMKAYELDWRIWEFQRGSGLDFWATSGVRSYNKR